MGKVAGVMTGLFAMTGFAMAFGAAVLPFAEPEVPWQACFILLPFSVAIGYLGWILLEGAIDVWKNG